jgi:hypothetical protein
MSHPGAVVLSVLLTLLLSPTAAAAIPAQSLRGHAWLDLTEDGAYLRVDRHEDAGPDGRVDDEYFLMMRNGAVAQLETFDLGDAFVTSTPQSVTIRSPHTRTQYVWVLEDAAETQPIDREEFGEHGPFGIDERLNPLYESPRVQRNMRIDTLSGYGIRYSAIRASRDEILADLSWQRRIVADAACDAGGECAAKQCSVTCSGGAACSVTCTGNTSACCICTGAMQKLPSCHCVPC